MEYTLTKELKDAGFPTIRMCDREEAHEIAFCSRRHDEHYPTLEELIEACGDEFLALINKTNDKWSAQGLTWVGVHKKEIWGKGSTSSEAVARLYLALKRTDTQ